MYDYVKYLFIYCTTAYQVLSLRSIKWNYYSE
jgi:hypothetical protein